jgi:SSS family solute:Na+ symporter
MKISGGAGVVEGIDMVAAQFPDRFHLILSKDNPHYGDLPGVAVLFGGMWIMNLSYWGFNQYIIQRALAAKNIGAAQTGIAFAAYLKLIMPVIVVLPGLAALILAPDLPRPDQAYPEIMKLLPPGVLGLVFASLIAAIVASLASKINSISTIFTLDVYAHARKGSSEGHLVLVGRLTSVAAMAIGVLAAKPLLGNFDQAFQYIQKFTGFFTPGIVVIFLLGMFWKRASAASAITAAVGSVVLSTIFNRAFPDLPFLDAVGLVFLITLGAAILVSLVRPAKDGTNLVVLDDIDYRTPTSFNLAAFGMIFLVAALYITLW